MTQIHIHGVSSGCATLCSRLKITLVASKRRDLCQGEIFGENIDIVLQCDNLLKSAISLAKKGCLIVMKWPMTILAQMTQD